MDELMSQACALPLPHSNSNGFEEDSEQEGFEDIENMSDHSALARNVVTRMRASQSEIESVKNVSRPNTHAQNSAVPTVVKLKTLPYSLNKDATVKKLISAYM